MGNFKNKNSAEVDIASAFGEIATACNVGQAKKGHVACLKSGQLVYARLDVNFLDLTQILTKSVECEMKVKGTGSRCLLQECVKVKYYARFHLHSYHCCREMNFISRLDVNFLDSTQNIDKVSGA